MVIQKTGVRKTMRRFALPLLVAAMLVATASPAAAAYDGTDPNGTGCDASATTLDNFFFDQGTTQLRYSSTCGTAWARFICANGSGCTNYNIMIYRVNDGRTYVNSVTWPTYTPVNASLYTLQLDDGQFQTAQACYKAAVDGYQWHCTGAF